MQKESNTNPVFLSASTIMNDEVYNSRGEHLGDIKELMIDLQSGSVAYAVLSFGGFLGLGDKLFAIPWQSLRQSGEKKYFILNVDKELLKDAPGFDKDNWPSSADYTFIDRIHTHYGYKPYERYHGRMTGGSEDTLDF